MKAQLGMGVYTISDTAEILKVNKSKIRYWFGRYVAGEFSKQTKHDGYFYDSGETIAVNFWTLIETFVFYHLRDKGVSTKKIVEAHNILSKLYKTPYPFAVKEFLLSGKDLLHKVGDDIVSLDKKGQYSLIDIIMHFAENIDFGKKFAQKYYPMGRESSIVINPKNQFGSPIIDGTNIKVSTIMSLYRGGEDSGFIAEIYEIEEHKVLDAIKFAA